MILRVVASRALSGQQYNVLERSHGHLCSKTPTREFRSTAMLKSSFGINESATKSEIENAKNCAKREGAQSIVLAIVAPIASPDISIHQRGNYLGT